MLNESYVLDSLGIVVLIYVIGRNSTPEIRNITLVKKISNCLKKPSNKLKKGKLTSDECKKDVGLSVVKIVYYKRRIPMITEHNHIFLSV